MEIDDLDAVATRIAEVAAKTLDELQAIFDRVERGALEDSSPARIPA